jgi:hypothetical protein
MILSNEVRYHKALVWAFLFEMIAKIANIWIDRQTSNTPIYKEICSQKMSVVLFVALYCKSF